MKQITHRQILAIIGGGALFMIALIIFLMVETHFFVQHARELERLKKDYVNYTLALKRMIAEHQQDQSEELSGLKKKE